MKTFGVWLSDEEKIGISGVLDVVARNPGLHRQHMEIRGSSKGEGGQLYIVAVREPSLTALEEMDYKPYMGYRQVHFQTRGPKKTRNLKPPPDGVSKGSGSTDAPVPSKTHVGSWESESP